MSYKHTQVEDCVKFYLNDKKISNYQIEINLPQGKGSNFMGYIMEITVQGRDETNENITLNLIGKFTKDDNEFRNRFSVRQIFLNEIFIYEFVLVQFEKLQKEKNIANIFNSYADFCISFKGDINETVILKDMIKKGFQVCRNTTSFDYDHALLLIREIARFHALSFAIRDQKPNIFREILDGIKEVEFNGIGVETNKNFCKMAYPQCIQTLDPIKNKIAFNKYRNCEFVFVDKIRESLITASLGPYAVVTHSDLWATNLLCKYDEKGQPYELCLLDWQLTKIASPASDILQIMFTCLDKNSRKKYYHNLIDEYYKSISSFLVELGSDPKIIFPFSVLQEHLRKFSLHALYIAMRSICCTSIIEEDTPHLSDKDALEAIAYAKRDTVLFNEKMRDLLLDYLEYGHQL